MTDSPEASVPPEHWVRERLERLTRASSEKRWELLQPHLHHPWWRELLLRCARQLRVEERRAEAERLVEALLDNESAYEDLLHRDLLLTSAVLAEDVTRSTRLLDLVRQRLERLYPSRGAVSHRERPREALL